MLLNSVFEINPLKYNTFVIPPAAFHLTRTQRSMPSVGSPPRPPKQLNSFEITKYVFDFLHCTYSIPPDYKKKGCFFLHIYVFIFTGSLSAQTDVLVSKLMMRRWEEATTTQANPSNVPQRGLARGRDLDEREGERRGT